MIDKDLLAILEIVEPEEWKNNSKLYFWIATFLCKAEEYVSKFNYAGANPADWEKALCRYDR